MPARLDICQCGKHGHFVLDDRSLSPEACFKQFASHLIHTGVEAGLLKDEDMPKLIAEVTSSGLPDTPGETDLFMLFNTELFNQATMEGVEMPYEHEHLCSTLHDTRSLRLIPDNFLELVCKTVHAFQPS